MAASSIDRGRRGSQRTTAGGAAGGFTLTAAQERDGAVADKAVFVLAGSAKQHGQDQATIESKGEWR